MKKNRLYTVNKWNMPAFMKEQKNLYEFGGGDINSLVGSQSQASGMYRMMSQYNSPGITNGLEGYLGGGSNPVTKSTGEEGPNFNAADNYSGGGASGFGGSAAGAAAAQAVGTIVAQAPNPGKARDKIDPMNLIYKGRHNKVGDAFQKAGQGLLAASASTGNYYLAIAGGVANILGGLTNAAWGTKTNEKSLEDTENAIARNNAMALNAESLDDVSTPMAAAATNVYEGGWFNSDDADEKNEKLRDKVSFSNRNVLNTIQNLRKNQINNAMATYAAYGGPLGFNPGALGIMQNNAYLDTIDRRTDAIAKNNSLALPTTTPSIKYADGGQMKAAFFDSFKSDPIGAVVRYNQGIEQLAAQREAAEAEAAREAEYAEMQKRLANLETQNQGLQALMAAQSVPSVPDITEEAPSTSTPSFAAPRVSSGNSNWDYIEDQLRRSGKFNDVQIQGIKYNLQRESGIGRYDGGDNGTARGLAQWRGDRIPSDMSLAGQTQYLIDTLSNYDGKLHWIGEDNYNGFLHARTPEEAHYYIAKGYERPHRDIVAKVKRDSDMSLKRLNAFGGELGTNGTDFTNGLLYIDEGGSHEDNPLDGVPIGVDAEGIPNLVEEGETVYNDYVFSDRMKVPAFMYKELGLGGVVKKKSDKTMSFADASKKLAQESEQRPNDPISKAGLDASLAKLAEVQETERMRKQMEDYVGLQGYACGGSMKHRYDYGGALKWLQENQPEIGNKKEIAKAIAAYEKKYPSTAKDSIRYSDIFGNITKGMGNFRSPSQFRNTTDAESGRKHYQELLDLGMDKKVAFGLAFPQVRKEVDPHSPSGYNVQRYNDYTKARTLLYNELVGGKKATAPSATKETAKPVANTPKPQSAPQATETNVTAPGSNKGYGVGASASATGIQPQGSSGGRGNASNIGNVNSNRNYGQEQSFLDSIAFDPHEDEVRAQMGFGQTPVIERDEAFRRAAAGEYTSPDDNFIAATTPPPSDAEQHTEYDPYPTWMRYAPAVGAGIMSLTDMLGLTNKPDYTYADKLEAAANQAAYAPHIEYDPIGDYMKYNPLDRQYYLNQLQASSRATDRALLNTSSPSRAAGLLANGYNTTLSMGNLARQAEEYNRDQYERTMDFNRRTNMFNSQMGLEAAMANARYTQQAKQLGLSGLGQAAALRDSIDSRVGAARSANITNFLNSLGDIGRENFAMNMINDDDAYQYGITGSGTTPFKRTAAGKKSRWRFGV